jgi:hypothetical protein
MARLCGHASALCGRSACGGTAGTGGIHISAGGVSSAWLRFSVIGRVSRASAAGVTWMSRTTSAQWAARYGHTSVVDAAGAIYVIGGWKRSAGTTTLYNDVWVSTDGGA